MSPNRHYQYKNWEHFKYFSYPNRHRCSGKPMLGLRGHHFQSSQLSHMAISNHMQYCSLLPPQILQAALPAKPRLHLLMLVRSFSFTTIHKKCYTCRGPLYFHIVPHNLSGIYQFSRAMKSYMPERKQNASLVDHLHTHLSNL